MPADKSPSPLFFLNATARVGPPGGVPCATLVSRQRVRVFDSSRQSFNRAADNLDRGENPELLGHPWNPINMDDA
jgi:hypothetical protein